MKNILGCCSLLLLSTAYIGRPAAALPAPSAYDFLHPTTTYVLPPELREISGQALLSNQRVGCIEDQTGNIYLYNLTTRRVESVLHFGKKGDYEDIARLNGSWLVLRSDGTLFKYTDQGVTSTYDTGLSGANNTEGLTYDASTNTLLVACKGSAGAGQPDQKRALYRLDPTTYQAAAKPTYVLDVDQITALAAGKSINRFAPSAVAIHPLTHHLFVLAASGNALAELDEQGKPLRVQKLPRKLFPQPEGLSFAPNGDLYISSEAGDNGDSGLLLFFRNLAGATSQ